MTTDRIWVLGASDPEMEMIERLLRECGERVEYATVWRDGVRRRVTPAEAYAPDVEIGEGLRGLRATAYMVECAPAVLVGSSIDGIDWAGAAITIDHHRPGDPGYGRPPEEFFGASSLGQVISELAKTGALRRAIPKEHEITHWMVSHRDLPVAEYNEMLRTQWFWSRQDMPGPEPYPSDGTISRGVSWIYDGYAVAVHQNDFYFERRVALIPRPIILAAAADHCLGAAYRGECPGVDPDALMRWRIETRAAHQGRSVDDILADVERAREALRRAKPISLTARPNCTRCNGSGMYYDAHGDDSASGQQTEDGYAVCPCGGYEPQWAADLRGQHVPELPEASARDGECFIADGLPGPDGRVKIVCQSGTREEIEAFMRVWAPAHGLMDIYGDPARGFAGGYLSHVEEATP